MESGFRVPDRPKNKNVPTHTLDKTDGQNLKRALLPVDRQSADMEECTVGVRRSLSALEENNDVVSTGEDTRRVRARMNAESGSDEAAKPATELAAENVNTKDSDEEEDMTRSRRQKTRGARCISDSDDENDIETHSKECGHSPVARPAYVDVAVPDSSSEQEEGGFAGEGRVSSSIAPGLDDASSVLRQTYRDQHDTIIDDMREVEEEHTEEHSDANGKGDATENMHIEYQNDSDEEERDPLVNIGITLQSVGEAQREPPLSTKHFMDVQKIGQHQIAQCFMGVDESNARKRYDVREQKKNTFMFVDKLDEKGSTPLMIQKVLYCLHMVYKYYNSLRHGGDKSKSNPFDVPHARPNDAYSAVAYGACYHKHLEDCTIVTTPIMNITMHIEQGNTGGASPLVVFYMMLQVDCPLTFDLIESIKRSCDKNSSMREILICQDMMRMWVEIVHHQASFGGRVGTDMMSAVGIDFAELFNEDSNKCLWTLCRSAVCVESMRRHMHMLATEYVAGRSKYNYGKASALVRVNFPNLDLVLDGNIDGHIFDATWSDVTRKCSIAFHNQYKQYKKAVLASKRKKKSMSEQQEEADDNPDGMDDGGANDEVHPFDPPVMYTTPTWVNWENDVVADFMLEFTADPGAHTVVVCFCFFISHCANRIFCKHIHSTIYSQP